MLWSLKLVLLLGQAVILVMMYVVIIKTGVIVRTSHDTSDDVCCDH